MILAAADYADERGDPPPELQLFFDCQDFPGALPNAGGVLDQPPGLIARMRVANNVYQVMRVYWKLDSRKFTQQFPNGQKVANAVLRLQAARAKANAHPHPHP